MIEYRVTDRRDHELILHCSFRLPSDNADLRPQVEGLVRRFEQFLAAGGVMRSEGNGAATEHIRADIIWTPTGLEIVYPKWPFGDEGLGVILRTLEQAVPELAGNTIIVDAGAELLPDLEWAEEELPRRNPNLPFALELVPFTWWINLECQFDRVMPAHVPGQLDSIIRLWADVASLGAFQVSLLPDEPPAVEFGVGVQGPTIGEDFLQWQCAISGVNPAGSDALINLIAQFSRTEFPLTMLYLG